MSSMPTLNTLRAFEAVARTGSVSAAASELSVTPGAVSRHVTALGKDLGVELIERAGRGLRLTTAGESLALRLRHAFAEIDEAIIETRRSPAGGLLHLSCAIVLAKTWLVPRLGAYYDGDVEIVMQDDPGRTGSPGIDSDVVITWGMSPPDGFDGERLGDQEVFAVCSPDLRRRIDESGMGGVTLLHYADIPPNWHWPTWSEFIEATGVEFRDDVRNIRLARGLIMDSAYAGQGLVLVNSVLAHDSLAEGHLVNALDGSMAIDSTYWLMTPRDRPLHAGTAAFCDWLREQYRQCFDASGRRLPEEKGSGRET